MNQFEQHGYSYIDNPLLVSLDIHGSFIDPYNHKFSQILISAESIAHDNIIVYTKTEGWLDINYQFFDILQLSLTDAVANWLHLNTIPLD